MLIIVEELQGDEIIGMATHLKKFVIDNNLYPTGPFVYQVLIGDSDINKYKIQLPINKAIALS